MTEEDVRSATNLYDSDES